MPAYNADHFSPPAPVAYVTLRNGNTNAIVTDVAMLIDTGADVTLVPAKILEQIGLEAVLSMQFELESFDGSTSFAPVVQLELIFLRRTFRGQFLTIDQEVGIIGRNILNSVSIALNGPALSWDELKR